MSTIEVEARTLGPGTIRARPGYRPTPCFRDLHLLAKLDPLALALASPVLRLLLDPRALELLFMSPPDKL